MDCRRRSHYDVPNSEIDITVPNDMPEGVYPLVVTANSDTSTKYAAATLIVDASPPNASVAGVSLPLTGTVSASGTVPLVVAWSASDAASGLASSHLQRFVGPGCGRLDEPRFGKRPHNGDHRRCL